MKKEILKGMLVGALCTIVIFSVCSVTYYGMEYAVSFDTGVTAISLIFFIIAGIIAFIMSKTKKNDIISKIAKIISFIVGILVIVASFENGIFNLTTIEYVMPGPTVALPNIIWLIIITIFCLANIDFKSKSNKKIFIFFLGSIISVISMFFLNIIIGLCINSNGYHLYEEQNDIINLIIRVICGTGIIGYSVYGWVKDSIKI